MSSQVYVAGRLVPKEQATVSVYDHGLLYGDGVFEGIRVYNRRVFLLQEHVERLYHSARAIRLTIPLSPEEMTRAVNETVAANGLTDGYVRLVVTRGAGSLGLDIRKTSHPQVIIIADTITLYPEDLYEKGLEIITAPTIRNHPAALSPRIKSLNYLNNILAKIEARQAGALEAIMLNAQGYVAECTADNVFVVQKGEILTPAASQGALKGITRQTIFDIAKELGLPMREADLTRYDVWCADEGFLTGTGAEVVPFVKLDGRVLGDGKPGPITRRVLASFKKRVLVEGTRI